MSQGQLLAFTFNFESGGTCYKCGIPLIMPSWFYEKRVSDHESFWCLNGHQQAYLGESKEQKLREELERKNEQLRYAADRESALRIRSTKLEHQLHGTKGALTKVKKRIANGVCPCCKRSFHDLQRHMSNRHPNYAGSDDAAS